MYSQSNEDDIITAIFGKYHRGTFVEFGCGKGNQNNTIALLKRGWTGLWLEIRKKCYKNACSLWRDEIERGQLVIRRRRATPEKINKVIPESLDFLSIDIDGNDYAVWAAINARPRIVCIEYDAINGTALKPMCDLAISKGYSFIDVSASGVNAFFQRDDRYP